MPENLQAGMLDQAPGELVRVRLEVAYDGTDFHGWATQSGGLRTVAGGCCRTNCRWSPATRLSWSSQAVLMRVCTPAARSVMQIFRWRRSDSAR